MELLLFGPGWGGAHLRPFWELRKYGRKYEKVQQSRVPARFCCSEVRKSATVSCSRSLLLFGSTKKCNSLVFPLAFGSLGSISQKGLPGVPPTTAKKWSVLNKIVIQERPFFEACQNLIFGWFAGWLASDVWKYEKVQQSRVPARFCCLEVRKSATVSCSRSLLLFGRHKSGGLKNRKISGLKEEAPVDTIYVWNCYFLALAGEGPI